MDASKSTPPKGENVSEGYSQQCYNCDHQWTHYGALDDAATCPSCGLELDAIGFHELAVVESVEWSVEIEASVPPEIERLARLRERVRDDERRDFYLNAARLAISWDESDGGPSKLWACRYCGNVVRKPSRPGRCYHCRRCEKTDGEPRLFEQVRAPVG